MIQLPVRRFMMIGAIALAVLVGGFGLWSVLAQINGAIVSNGQVALRNNRQVVQHPSGGVVADILVTEGDLVARGDILIRLDAAQIQSDLAMVEAQYFALLARRARLEAERDDTTTLIFDPMLLQTANTEFAALMAGQKQLFAARQETALHFADQLAQRRAQIASQITGIRAQQAALATQHALTLRELADQQSLLRNGLTQTSRVLALQREDAVLSGRSGELIALAAQAAERMAEIDLQLQSIGSSRREEALGELRDVQTAEMELAERRQALIRDLARRDIRAPVSGFIHDLRVFAPQSVIRPAEHILFVIPRDEPLVIVSPVETSDIDRVFVGQDVILRFSAVSQRRLPDLSGSVTRLSADVFRDENTGLAHYRTEIAIQHDNIGHLPADLRLLPGMPVDVFIQTGARRPLDYLLEPLAYYFRRSLRDG